MNELVFQHYLLGLIAVANNIPAIPLYLELCEGLTFREQHKLCLIATVTSFITMITAMFTGVAILQFFDISIHAFRIAGGLLLLTTGAGTMSTIILFSQQIHNSGTLTLKLLGAIVCMTLIIYLSFRYSTEIIKVLGKTGMDVLAKIFGLITLALGIQFIITGIQGAFPRLI